MADYDVNPDAPYGSRDMDPHYPLVPNPKVTKASPDTWVIDHRTGEPRKVVGWAPGQEKVGGPATVAKKNRTYIFSHLDGTTGKAVYVLTDESPATEILPVTAFNKGRRTPTELDTQDRKDALKARGLKMRVTRKNLHDIGETLDQGDHWSRA
jgi:hypothetical protein